MSLLAIARRLVDRIRLAVLLRHEYDSLALRAHFRDRWAIEIGLYSYGCFDRWRIPPGTVIGRYCSFARSARILDANHPVEALSTHPFLYERRFGVVAADRIQAPPALIEDDVWVSHNAIVTPSCKHIGRGAIIGAGAVVTRDVPAYAIVAGNPARILRPRFPPDLIAAIEASRWWTLDKDQLARLVERLGPAAFRPTAASLEAATGSHG